MVIRQPVAAHRGTKPSPLVSAVFHGNRRPRPAQPPARLLRITRVQSQEPARRAAELLDSAAASGWRGADPFDGLWGGWAKPPPPRGRRRPKPLAAGRRRRQAVMQVHVRTPVDIRRLYRRERPPNPKGLGIYGSVGIRLWRLTGDDRYSRVALDALSELDADRNAGPDAWGYHWDMQLRWSFYPGGSPNVVVTFFAARGLAEAAELGEDELHARARGAAPWTLDTLYRPRPGVFA